MTAPHYTRLVARALRRDDSEAAPAVSPASRATGIAAIEAAMAERQKRQWRGRAFAIVSVAAALALGIGSYFKISGATNATSDAASAEVVVAKARSVTVDSVLMGPMGSTPLHEGSELMLGRAVVTGPHASAGIELSTGTHLVVDPASSLAFLDNSRTQRFELRTGAVQASVAKLAAGHRFIIGTPDAEIEVHGTAFRVEALPVGESCSGSQTRVIVTQGVVSVRHGNELVRIPAGSQWPASCSGLAPALRSTSDSPGSQSAEPLPVQAQAPHHREPGLAGHLSSTPVEVKQPTALEQASMLAEQNGAFGSAIAAARRGEHRAALEAFSDFLNRYPTSQLRESAVVEQLRLLIRLEPERARGAAQRYLEAYPAGNARSEAREVLDGSKP